MNFILPIVRAMNAVRRADQEEAERDPQVRSGESRQFFHAPKKPGGGHYDLRERCEIFKMTAKDEADEKFLAHLYCAIYEGGAVSIATPEKTAFYTLED